MSTIAGNFLHRRVVGGPKCLFYVPNLVSRYIAIAPNNVALFGDDKLRHCISRIDPRRNETPTTTPAKAVAAAESIGSNTGWHGADR